MLQRDVTRRAEVAAFAHDIAARPAPATITANLAGLRFALGKRESVQWLDATVEDHRQRIALLSRIRAGIDQTVQRHEEAVRQITEAGVTCLRDIVESAA